jgi:hypothetical protein
VKRSKACGVRDSRIADALDDRLVFGSRGASRFRFEGAAEQRDRLRTFPMQYFAKIETEKIDDHAAAPIARPASYCGDRGGRDERYQRFGIGIVFPNRIAEILLVIRPAILTP